MDFETNKKQRTVAPTAVDDHPPPPPSTAGKIHIPLAPPVNNNVGPPALPFNNVAPPPPPPPPPQNDAGDNLAEKMQRLKNALLTATAPEATKVPSKRKNEDEVDYGGLEDEEMQFPSLPTPKKEGDTPSLKSVRHLRLRISQEKGNFMEEIEGREKKEILDSDLGEMLYAEITLQQANAARLQERLREVEEEKMVIERAREKVESKFIEQQKKMDELERDYEEMKRKLKRAEKN